MRARVRRGMRASNPLRKLDAVLRNLNSCPVLLIIECNYVKLF